MEQNDIKNILALIARANITGAEAIGVAVLQQKLAKMLEPVKEETKEE